MDTAWPLPLHTHTERALYPLYPTSTLYLYSLYLSIPLPPHTEICHTKSALYPVYLYTLPLPCSTLYPVPLYLCTVCTQVTQPYPSIRHVQSTRLPLSVSFPFRVQEAPTRLHLTECQQLPAAETILCKNHKYKFKYN